MLSVNFIAVFCYIFSIFCVINYFGLIFTNHELNFIKVVCRYEENLLVVLEHTPGREENYCH